MATRTPLTTPLTDDERAEHEARMRQEWEASFIRRIEQALLLEPRLATRIVVALTQAMERDDRLASRVRLALPKRGENGRPRSVRARRALTCYEVNLGLYEAHAPGKRGNKARALRDAVAFSKLTQKTVEKLVAKGNTRK